RQSRTRNKTNNTNIISPCSLQCPHSTESSPPQIIRRAIGRALCPWLGIPCRRQRAQEGSAVGGSHKLARLRCGLGCRLLGSVRRRTRKPRGTKDGRTLLPLSSILAAAFTCTSDC